MIVFEILQFIICQMISGNGPKNGHHLQAPTTAAPQPVGLSRNDL